VDHNFWVMSKTKRGHKNARLAVKWMTGVKSKNKKAKKGPLWVTIEEFTDNWGGTTDLEISDQKFHNRTLKMGGGRRRRVNPPKTLTSLEAKSK